MAGRLDITELFFSAAGRLPRGMFLIAAAVLIGLTMLYEAVIWPPLHWVTGLFVYPLILFCAACVLAKRLHDRGRNGWWAALILVAVIAVWPEPQGFFDFLFALVIVWAVVDLAVIPGEQGTNRFGPNPLRPVQA
jgi:uncharacterized membrane protein YhaH (DUF805 family)